MFSKSIIINPYIWIGSIIFFTSVIALTEFQLAETEDELKTIQEKFDACKK